MEFICSSVFINQKLRGIYILYYTVIYNILYILYISLFNKFTFENFKNVKKQEACRKPVSFITRHLRRLYFKYFQLTSRNLVLLVAIIHIVCTQFLPKRQHFLPPWHGDIYLHNRKLLILPQGKSCVYVLHMQLFYLSL